MSVSGIVSRDDDVYRRNRGRKSLNLIVEKQKYILLNQKVLH
jgi:hypothetical protein